MNVEAVVLYLLLKSETQAEAILRYSEVKREYFSTGYTSILGAIVKFYEEYGKVPSLGELKLRCSRTTSLSNSIAALEMLDIPDISDFDLAIDTLRDQFTQQEYLKLISKSLDDISMRSSSEIMDLANMIPVELEATIKPNSFLHSAKDIPIFKSKADAAEDVIFTGISNKFDAEYGATRRGEVFLIGGRRGAGKSVICANIADRAEGLFVPYFSIEMSAEETLMRYLGIRAGVDAIKIRNQDFDIDDLGKLAAVRADMFSNGKEILDSCGLLVELDDFIKFEETLMLRGIEREDGGLIIIDDPELKISSIDMHLTNLKAKYGKRLGMAVVDYINQVSVDGSTDITMYDWKMQIAIAKRLKALARKHGIVIFAPYQIDDSGEARMAKGILDSCDFAFTVEAIHPEKGNSGALRWKGTKARGLPAINFSVAIEWNTLKISPAELSDADLLQIMGSPVEEEEPKKRKKKEVAPSTWNNKESEEKAHDWELKL